MTKEKELELNKVYETLGTGGCSNTASHGAIFEEIINSIKPKHILEIGFFVGGSATLFLELTKELGTKLTSVDPIDDNTTTDYLKATNQADQIQECSRQFA